MKISKTGQTIPVVNPSGFVRTSNTASNPPRNPQTSVSTSFNQAKALLDFSKDTGFPIQVGSESAK